MITWQYRRSSNGSPPLADVVRGDRRRTGGARSRAESTPVAALSTISRPGPQRAFSLSRKRQAGAPHLLERTPVDNQRELIAFVATEEAIIWPPPRLPRRVR